MADSKSRDRGLRTRARRILARQSAAASCRASGSGPRGGPRAGSAATPARRAGCTHICRLFVRITRGGQLRDGDQVGYLLVLYEYE